MAVFASIRNTQSSYSTSFRTT